MFVALSSPPPFSSPPPPWPISHTHTHTHTWPRLPHPPACLASPLLARLPSPASPSSFRKDAHVINYGWGLSLPSAELASALGNAATQWNWMGLLMPPSGNRTGLWASLSFHG